MPRRFFQPINRRFFKLTFGTKVGHGLSPESARSKFNPWAKQVDRSTGPPLSPPGRFSVLWLSAWGWTPKRFWGTH